MQLYGAQRVNIVMLFLQIKAMQKSKCHREEPPQNPNKSPKKCSFFMEVFTWLEPGWCPEGAYVYIIAKNAYIGRIFG